MATTLLNMEEDDDGTTAVPGRRKRRIEDDPEQLSTVPEGITPNPMAPMKKQKTNSNASTIPPALALQPAAPNKVPPPIPPRPRPIRPLPQHDEASGTFPLVVPTRPISQLQGDKVPPPIPPQPQPVPQPSTRGEAPVPCHQTHGEYEENDGLPPAALPRRPIQAETQALHDKDIDDPMAPISPALQDEAHNEAHNQYSLDNHDDIYASPSHSRRPGPCWQFQGQSPQLRPEG